MDLILDSGCNHSMASSINLLQGVSVRKGEITVASGDTLQVSHSGTIRILGHNIPAFFVPVLRHDLISVEQLSSVGLAVSFSDDMVTIIHGNKLLTTRKRNHSGLNCINVVHKDQPSDLEFHRQLSAKYVSQTVGKPNEVHPALKSRQLDCHFSPRPIRPSAL